MNQESLFYEDGQKISYIIKDDKSGDWSNDEKLSNEFSSIGFYISGHPINEYKDILKIYNTVTYSNRWPRIYDWFSFHTHRIRAQGFSKSKEIFTPSFWWRQIR